MISNKKKVLSKTSKTSKGYRLKNSTHCLVEKIQLMINGSKDTVISRSLKLYYAQLNIADKKSKSESKKRSQ